MVKDVTLLPWRYVETGIYLSCLEQCPYRRPDWRWQLAAHLPVGLRMRRRPELKDTWVKRVQRILRAGTPGMSPPWHRREEKFGGLLNRACEIRFHPDPLVAAEVEAWVLSGSTQALIAERCGLPVEVIETYEKLFFDVRPRLEAASYILHTVIGRPILYGFSLDDLGSIWKFCAYMRGPYALDVLLFVFPGEKPRPWPSNFPATPAERSELIAACERMVWTRCLRPADMSPADRSQLLFLNKWDQKLHKANDAGCSGIGAISKIDVSSLIEPRTEDWDSIAPSSCSSPASILRSRCTESGGLGTADRQNRAESGSNDFHLSVKPVEPAHRVIA
jgi:hypothetical protein